MSKNICCGNLEKMLINWMSLEDGRLIMPYLQGHSDDVLYRVNYCPSCGKYVRKAIRTMDKQREENK